MEAYSKARTADAITALGLLRPADALLLTSTSTSNNATTFRAPDEDLEKGDPVSEKEAFSVPSGVKVEKVDVTLLEVGDIVRVQCGSTPPADGTITSGEGSAFDESSLTGESKLIKKQVGDKVYLGTINKSKMVDIRVDAIGGATM